MDWLDPTIMESVQQISATAVEATRPTNPSSLTLAVIGAMTFLAFGFTRRRIQRTPFQSVQQKPSTGIKPRRAA